MTLRLKTVISGWPGGPGLTTFHFDSATEDAAAAAAAATLTQAFWTAIRNMWLTSVSAQVQPRIELFNKVTGALEGEFSTSKPLVVGNVSAVDFLPYATQGLIKWNTASFVSGHHVQGRTFIPGMHEGLSEGNPNSSFSSGVDAAVNAILATGPDLVIWTRPRAADPGHVPPITARLGSTSVITAGTAGTKWAVLTSRRD